jgi:hypothetical protein
MGNISGGNQPLSANYGNFNLSRTILIQRGDQKRWEEWFEKSPLQIMPLTSHEFCKSPLPPSTSSPLDQDRVTRIEVFIVCMKRSVSTWYVAFKMTQFNRVTVRTLNSRSLKMRRIEFIMICEWASSKIALKQTSPSFVMLFRQLKTTVARSQIETSLYGCSCLLVKKVLNKWV